MTAVLAFFPDLGGKQVPTSDRRSAKERNLNRERALGSGSKG